MRIDSMSVLQTSCILGIKLLVEVKSAVGNQNQPCRVWPYRSQHRIGKSGRQYPGDQNPKCALLRQYFPVRRNKFEPCR